MFTSYVQTVLSVLLLQLHKLQVSLTAFLMMRWSSIAYLSIMRWFWSPTPILNLGLMTARRRAMDRPAWRLLVDAATSLGHAPQRETPVLAMCPFRRQVAAT